jgi:hypothetical protein
MTRMKGNTGEFVGFGRLFVVGPATAVQLPR